MIKSPAGLRHRILDAGTDLRQLQRLRRRRGSVLSANRDGTVSMDCLAFDGWPAAAVLAVVMSIHRMRVEPPY